MPKCTDVTIHSDNYNDQLGGTHEYLDYTDSSPINREQFQRWTIPQSKCDSQNVAESFQAFRLWNSKVCGSKHCFKSITGYTTRQFFNSLLWGSLSDNHRIRGISCRQRVAVLATTNRPRAIGKLPHRPTGVGCRAQKTQIAGQASVALESARIGSRKAFAAEFEKPVHPQEGMRQFKMARVGRGCGPTAFSASLQQWLDRALPGLDAVFRQQLLSDQFVGGLQPALGAHLRSARANGQLSMDELVHLVGCD
ncbi:hypothetical protein CLF_100580 [Clonorchis sinensis]|uniref:Uncharacterized protein n=1 Tax=Clonorchis sinensis TaxID=79923 RepID=G7Y3S6_CLOSI|nr:hypothetical protein CLF_100580 [Clonorchis sinensis]